MIALPQAGVLFAGAIGAVWRRMRLVVFVGCLSAVGARSSAQQMSIDALRAALDGNTVTGATIITHGYQPFDNAGDALMPLAQSVFDRTTSWLIDYEVVGGKSFIDVAGSTLPGGMNQTRHAVVLFDWARESDETKLGWVEGAGDALFNLVVNLGLANPKAGTAKDLHFIGHSFGTAVTSEAIERLARYNVPVDQATYLDPHEFDQPNLSDDVTMTTLGKPAGYGATVWNNVAFADTYYETRGTNALGRDNGIVPRGRPIPGSYNRFLDDGSELPDDGDGTQQQSPYPGDLSGDHTYVWNDFYRATVEKALPLNGKAPEGNVEWDKTGYNFSKIGLAADNTLARPAAEFFGAAPGQDHLYSDRNYATAAGAAGPQAPNAAAFTTAKYAPDWDRLSIFNGNFELDPQNPPPFINPLNIDDDNTPGWDTHSDVGGGIAETATLTGNTFLVLTEASGYNGTSRTHDRQYVPHDARRLEFDLWIPTAGANDALNVLLDGTSLGTFSTMNATAGFAKQFVPLATTLRNNVRELTFRVDLTAGMGTPVVRIDNVRYSLVPEPAGAWMLAVAGCAAPFRRRMKSWALRVGCTWNLIDISPNVRT
jgi:hypothetical protein